MIFRSARHTNDLNRIKNFYCKVLGLELLGSFQDHDGYDGIFIGRQDLTWHLEFTLSKDKATHTFDDDDILVFYPESKWVYEKIANRLIELGIEQYVPKNPYWRKHGILIKDPDGYNVIVCNTN